MTCIFRSDQTRQILIWVFLISSVEMFWIMEWNLKHHLMVQSNDLFFDCCVFWPAFGNFGKRKPVKKIFLWFSDIFLYLVLLFRWEEFISYKLVLTLLQFLATEWQSHRVTDTQGYSVKGLGEIFLGLISINSPTRFARRGMIVVHVRVAGVN